MRKLIAIVVLMSMTMHCAGRLGVLSYLYKNQEVIVQTLGLEIEHVISLCSSKYAPHEFTFPVEKKQSYEIAAAFEINLNVPVTPLSCKRFHFIPQEKPEKIYITYFQVDLLEVFQPPSLA